MSLDDRQALLSPDEVDTTPPLVDTVAPGTDHGGDPTDRRTFSITTALAALGIADPLQALFRSPAPPTSLSMDHVQTMVEIIDRFEQADAAMGGDAYYQLGIALHSRLGRWERASSYTPAVGGALRTALGELECWIGWLAYDAEQRSTSRQFLQDAIVRARFRDDPHLEVRAMVYLSLLIREARPLDSLHCAEAAMRISDAWAHPRLTALLHLRAAHAQSVLGDAGSFARHLAQARTHFDRGPDEDDPTYIHFVTPMEAAGIEGLAQLALGRPDRATRAFRGITEHPDPTYRRNHGYYSVQLAGAIRRQGDITQASAIALDAVPTVARLRSRRTQRLFASLRKNLGEHSARSAPARDFVDAYDAAVSR